MLFTHKKEILSSSQVQYLVEKNKLFDVKLLVLFGSHAKGTTWAESDIDIGFLAEKRFTLGFLEDLVVDILRFTGTRKVNVVDLYFRDKPSLLQFEIYKTGNLLYERDKNLFSRNKQNAVAAYSDLSGEEINKKIILDKLQFLKGLLGQISMVLNTKLIYGEERFELLEKNRSYASQQNAREIVEMAIRMNRFILLGWFKRNSRSRYDTFLDLLKFNVCDDKDFMEELASTAAFDSMFSIDYSHGSSWSVMGFVRRISQLYPKYIKMIEEFIHNEKFLDD